MKYHTKYGSLKKVPRLNRLQINAALNIHVLHYSRNFVLMHRQENNRGSHSYFNLIN